MKRSGKFWYKNEKDVMKELGLKQVPGSGNGWVSKEDGENEHILCQLKSTDANSIRVQKQDIDKLEYHALVSKKLPVFAIQFVSTGQVYLVIKPLDVPDIAKFIDTGIYTPKDDEGLRELLDDSERRSKKAKPKVKSSANAREAWHKARSERFKKKENSAT